MINRNNYEEFLLMYVDNELTSQERTAVELFVQQNPDLLPELETLLQTKLSIDDEILMEDKSGLLKINSSISIENYEEYFLLDIDDELDTEAKNDVEKFVLQHPKLQEEFTLLKQTVLEPEQIVFTDKQSLYRKEERVIPLTWMRLAVAAAVIGFAVLIWWMIPAGNNSNELANTKPGKENSIPTVKDINSTIHQQPVITAPQQSVNDIANATDKEDKTKDIAVAKENKIKTKQPLQKPNVISTENIALNKVQGTQQKNKASEQVVVVVPKQEDIAYTAPVTSNSNDHVAHGGYVSVKSTATDVADANIVKPAVYKELNTDDDRDESLYVGNLNLNKNKLRGVIKKVGGLFAGKAKNATASNDQGKLQVANLEFNTN